LDPVKSIFFGFPVSPVNSANDSDQITTYQDPAIFRPPHAFEYGAGIMLTPQLKPDQLKPDPSRGTIENQEQLEDVVPNFGICRMAHQEQRMSETVENLKSLVEKLSSSERAELAEFLIHSLDQEQDDDAETLWELELTRRVNDIKTGKAVGKPAEQVFAELRKKLS
jgi:putative addiction module component (TIGR02574 family)